LDVKPMKTLHYVPTRVQNIFSKGSTPVTIFRFVLTAQAVSLTHWGAQPTELTSRTCFDKNRAAELS